MPNKLKIFISWSGKRSKLVAEAFRKWLPIVLEGTDPFMSSVDIEKGTTWDPYISRQLAQTKFGIICLTPENRLSPAIHFEAGALSKSLSLRGKRLWTYLYELNNTDIKWPLSSFQHTIFEKRQTKLLLESVNGLLGEYKRDEKVFNVAFDTFWPLFEGDLRNIPPPSKKAPQRSDRDILEELLELIRASRNEYETTRLLELHRMSLAHLISPIIEEVLDGIERGPNFYNYHALFRRIRTAIQKTRMLLKGVQHPEVGDLKNFLEKHFSNRQLARFIKKKIESLILRQDLNTKEKRDAINSEIEIFETEIFEGFYEILKGKPVSDYEKFKS